jgi:hypothetical protein
MLTTVSGGRVRGAVTGASVLTECDPGILVLLHPLHSSYVCPLLNKQQRRRPTTKNFAGDFDHNHDVEEEIFDQGSCPGFFASHACFLLSPDREIEDDADNDDADNDNANADNKNDENGADGAEKTTRLVTARRRRRCQWSCGRLEPLFTRNIHFTLRISHFVFLHVFVVRGFVCGTSSS